MQSRALNAESCAQRRAAGLMQDGMPKAGSCARMHGCPLNVGPYAQCGAACSYAGPCARMQVRAIESRAVRSTQGREPEGNTLTAVRSMQGRALNARV